MVSETVFERMKSLGVTNGVFLFVSNEKDQLEAFALRFARDLLGYKSEDVALNERIYRPVDGAILADQVNDFIEFESKKAVSVSSKILIMYDVDLLKDSVSDKMLKCIEDYSNDSLIIFTTTALENVSRTIKSRCMVFKSWSDRNNPYVEFKDKFLGFQAALKEASNYSEVENILASVSELNLMDVIQALFANASNYSDISIAKTALDANLTGSQSDQVFSYIVNSYWCLYQKLRTWENNLEMGVN